MTSVEAPQRAPSLLPLVLPLSSPLCLSICLLLSVEGTARPFCNQALLTQGEKQILVSPGKWIEMDNRQENGDEGRGEGDLGVPVCVCVCVCV